MKIVEVINGVVTSMPTFWKTAKDIPKGIPPIYFEAPQEVEEGWIFDGKTFSKPDNFINGVVMAPHKPTEMTLEQATSLIVAAEILELEIPPGKRNEAIAVIAKVAGIPIETPSTDGIE